MGAGGRLASGLSSSRATTSRQEQLHRNSIVWVDARPDPSFKPTRHVRQLDSNVRRQFLRFTNDSSAHRATRQPWRWRMKAGEVLRLLQADGWLLVATRGSHRRFKHSAKPGRATVPGQPSDDLDPGTLSSILKQTGLKRNQSNCDALRRRHRERGLEVLSLCPGPSRLRCYWFVTPFAGQRSRRPAARR